MSESSGLEDRTSEHAGTSSEDEQDHSLLSRIIGGLVRFLATLLGRGSGSGGGLGVGDAGLARTDIIVRPFSRFPDLDDYDPSAHAWQDSYVDPPNGYTVGVSACAGLETRVGEEDVESIIDEVERERRRSPRPGDGTRMPGDEPPRSNVGGRTVVPDDIVAWHWTITDDDGNEVTSASRSSNLGPSACSANLLVPDLGRYHVDLRLELADGEETGKESFALRDESLIVSVGDSFASGEGNPDEPSHPTLDGDTADPVWLDPRGNRSLRSGPALAAEAFEDAPRGELVTFLSFADTGAEIDRGLLGEQHLTGGGGPPGDVGDTDQRLMFNPDDESRGGQLDQVDRTLGNRTIDALIVSVGGNDVGFADGLKDLLYRLLETRSETVSDTQAAIDRLLEDYQNKQGDRVAAKYDRLAERIESLEADVENVLITEYPIALFDAEDDGTVGGGCGVFDPAFLNDIPPAGEFAEVLNKVIPNISEADARAIKDLGRRLNRAVERAADRHGWTYVDGIVEGFEGHGYCRSDENRYFVTASESWDDQGDLMGMMHPNAKGHEVYRDRILDALERTVGSGGADDDDAPTRGDGSDGGDRGDDSGAGGRTGGDDDGTDGSVGGGAVGGGSVPGGDADREPKRRR